MEFVLGWVAFVFDHDGLHCEAVLVVHKIFIKSQLSIDAFAARYVTWTSGKDRPEPCLEIEQMHNPSSLALLEVLEGLSWRCEINTRKFSTRLPDLSPLT